MAANPRPTPTRNRLRRTGRTTLVAVAIVATTLSTAACPKKDEPSVPSVAGFRYDRGGLRFWTGAPCTGVTEVTIDFGARGKDSTLDASFRPQTLILTAPEPGVTIEYLDFDNIDSTLTVEQPLPADFDWREAEVVRLDVDGDIPTWSSSAYIEDVAAGSLTHPSDTYLFGTLGWMNPTDIAEGNGKDFITICTPDPAKDDE